MYDEYDNLLPVRRVVNHDLFFPSSNPLTVIANQLPQESLNYLDRVRVDEHEIARVQARSQVQSNVINGLSSMGNNFLATRYPGEQHLRLNVDAVVNPTFFGGWG